MTKTEIENLRTEGERGIEDLAKMARELGFKGVVDQLQFKNGAFVTDILAMFEDSPGMIEGIYNFVLENGRSFEIEDEEEEDEEETEEL
jgi:hypothetical protein